MPGSGVNPSVVHSYDGGDIVLDGERGVMLSPAVFPELEEYAGQDLVVTDGKTLLGADDKAGIAEIMDMAASFLLHPERPHGDIRIAFTPDEEIGRGADNFDVARFGADFAYTVDGGRLGEIEYENFNAASAVVTAHGKSIHPGSAKGRMVNASLLLMEFQAMLPAFQNPACTEGYEGFYHLDSFRGDVEQAAAEYLIRGPRLRRIRAQKGIHARLRRPAEPEIRGGLRRGGNPGFLLQHAGKNPAAHAPGWTMPAGAMEAVGVRPEIVPVRGGTDGRAPFLHGAALSQSVRGRPQLPWKIRVCPRAVHGENLRHPSGNRFRIRPRGMSVR